MILPGMAILFINAWLDDPMRWASLLPERSVARDCFQANIDFSHHLEFAIEVHPTPELKRLAKLARQSNTFWCEANWFHSCGSMRAVHLEIARRKAIMAVIESIGWERFIRQDWPKPIPVE